jgi:hypothetical protein
MSSPTTTQSLYDPNMPNLGDLVNKSIHTALKNSAVPDLAGGRHAGNAVEIRNKAEDLLLGGIILPEKYYEYVNPTGSPGTPLPVNGATVGVFDPCAVCDSPKRHIKRIKYGDGKILPGIVSSKMNCNPKGAFCYTQTIDNKSDSSAKDTLNLSLVDEYSVEELALKYFQQLSLDSRYANCLTSQQIADICDELTLQSTLTSNSDGTASVNWSTPLVQALAPFFDATGIAYTINQDSPCSSVNFTQFQSFLAKRFQIMQSLQLSYDSNGAKEKEGFIKQSFQVSWDFCNAPTIRACGGKC